MIQKQKKNSRIAPLLSYYRSCEAAYFYVNKVIGSFKLDQKSRND